MAITYGAFTPATAAGLIAASATPLETPVPSLYVNSVTGSNGYDGLTAQTPLLTIGEAVGRANNGTTIGIFGVFREYVTARLGLQDVTIIGMGNTPRQATSGGVANGGGATWLSPTTVTNSSDLLTIKGQAWKIQNIYFNNAGTSSACVRLLRSGTGDPPADPDGSHTSFVNCRFTGTSLGLEDEGGNAFVSVTGCEFFNFAGTGDIAITSTGSLIANPLRWVITNSYFWGNVNHIVAPASGWIIQGCRFNAATTTAIDFTGGTAPNFVQQNAFAVAAADFDPAGGVTGVTGDVWSNYLKDAVETGLPAN
jgi:hypothetical protein